MSWVIGSPLCEAGERQKSSYGGTSIKRVQARGTCPHSVLDGVGLDHKRVFVYMFSITRETDLLKNFKEAGSKQPIGVSFSFVS